MNAVSTIRIACVFAACLLVVGCRTPVQRQISSQAFMDRGTVAGNSRKAIWESVARAQSCDVTVTYCGSTNFQARLLPLKQNTLDALSRAGALATVSTGPEPITVKLRDVQAIWLECRGPRGKTNSEAAAYTVERVNSSPDTRILDIATLPAATHTNVMVFCGGAMQSVWKSPLPLAGPDSRCDVTVRVRSIGRGKAVLNYQKENGLRFERTVNRRSELVTLRNVINIGVICEGPRGGRCSVEVMQVNSPQ